MTDKLHIFAVSDSVGETAEKIAVASVLQLRLLQTGQPRKIGDLFLIKKDFTPVLPNF